MSVARNKLSAELAGRCGISVERAREYLEQVLKAIADTLAAGKSVELRGFGILEPVVRKERVGRNPRDPTKTYKVPSRKSVRFRASKYLRAQINMGLCE